MGGGLHEAVWDLLCRLRDAGPYFEAKRPVVQRSGHSVQSDAHRDAQPAADTLKRPAQASNVTTQSAPRSMLAPNPLTTTAFSPNVTPSKLRSKRNSRR